MPSIVVHTHPWLYHILFVLSSPSTHLASLHPARPLTTTALQTFTHLSDGLHNIENYPANGGRSDPRALMELSFAGKDVRVKVLPQMYSAIIEPIGMGGAPHGC
jgi:hypothetical protein